MCDRAMAGACLMGGRYIGPLAISRQEQKEDTHTLFENLGRNGHGGVDRVGDDSHPCFRAVLGNAFTQRLHNSCTSQAALVMGMCCLLMQRTQMQRTQMRQHNCFRGPVMLPSNSHNASTEWVQ